VDVLKLIKQRMHADRKQNDFVAQLDSVGGKHPNSQVILEFCGTFYSEANRETQYFEILIKLFDVYFNAGNVQKASEALERSIRHRRLRSSQSGTPAETAGPRRRLALEPP